jgi:acetate kinase
VDVRTVLVVNAGSSSLKLRLLGDGEEPIAARDLAAGADWEQALESFLADSPEPDAAGHRVVHGGDQFTAPVRIDAEVEHHLRQLADLAPLHNPPAVRGIGAVHHLRPSLPAVACFDTAFHSSLPKAAATYAVPAAWSERWPLRRFGFHGLSHAYCARRVAELLDRPPAELRVVTAHLGAGASLAAVAGGRSVDTTMGFTPMEGLVMATRSGSIDPGLLLWVQRHGEIDAETAERALDRESGLLGLSGRSGDMRELLNSAEAGDERSSLAVEVYLHRLRASIASMAAGMGGLDALAFTGGVGERSGTIRARACEGLEFLGLALDRGRDETKERFDRVLSLSEAATSVVLVHAREDLEIAAQVRATLTG